MSETPRIIDETLIREITDRIVEAVHPRRVMLFGSYARGDFGPHSDLDIFVEMESNEKPYERRRRIGKLFMGRWWPMDLIVFTPEEVADLRDTIGSIMPTIEREGKLLYEE
jgi:predicted nucleotidyltransferase